MAGIANSNGAAGRIGNTIGIVGDPFGNSGRDTSSQGRVNRAPPSQSSSQDSDSSSSSTWRDPLNDRSSSSDSFRSGSGLDRSTEAFRNGEWAAPSSSSDSSFSDSSSQSSFDSSFNSAEADRRAEEEQSAQFLAQGLDAHGFPIPTALERAWDAMLVDVDTVDAAVKAVRAPPGSPLAVAIDHWNKMSPTQPDERV